MKIYKKPKINIIDFTADDVIVTSLGNGTDGTVTDRYWEEFDL